MPGGMYLYTFSKIGKLQKGRQELIFVPGGRQTIQLPFLIDQISKGHFLIDSGAAISLLPYRHGFCADSKASQVKFSVKSANGSNINTYGQVVVPLSFAGKTHKHTFTCADVSQPILGIDFLSSHKAVIDFQCNVLQINCTCPSLAARLNCSIKHNKQRQHGHRSHQGAVRSPRVPPPQHPLPRDPPPPRKPPSGLVFLPSSDQSRPRFAVPVPKQSSIVSVNNIQVKVKALLDEFADVCSEQFSATKPRHGVKHHIKTTGAPIRSKPRRLDPQRLEAAKAEFLAMEAAGIVRRSNSPWSSPLHLVPKPGGAWRPCGDYRRLNNATVPDRYNLPNLRDFSAQLAGKRIFSTIDLLKGYLQVDVDEESIPKTAIITPFGTWEFLRLPFGVKNAAATFQRLMDVVLQGLPFIFCYLDDILVASSTADQHMQDLRQVFERLRLNGLSINPAKCCWAAPSVKYLGHLVDAQGIRPLPKHVETIRQFQPPNSRESLSRFLGLLNFYRPFLPNLAEVVRPLTELLSPKVTFTWSDKQESAFSASKQLLESAMALHHPVPGVPLRLSTDASDIALGAALDQMVAGIWQPLGFYSRHFTAAERNYSTFDRELCAAYHSVRHFKHILEGSCFQLQLDHKPLVQAFAKISDPWSGRQARMLQYLSEFSLEPVFIPGQKNLVADTLSRPVSAVVPACSRAMPSEDEFASAQAKCPAVQSLLSSSVLSITKKVLESGAVLFLDVSRSQPRILVPDSLRRQVFDAIHSVSHPGARASCRLVSQAFVWTRMAADVKEYCRACVDCQRSKITRHISAPPASVPVPARRFSAINVDLVGPLPPAGGEGYRYILSIIDRNSRWFELLPLTNIDAATVCRALVSGWISRYGVPAVIYSDRGSQFVSSLWNNLGQLLGFKPSTTTSYHPQGNGLVERLHRSIKASLRARRTVNWLDDLPWVALGLRAAPREDSGVSAAERVFGLPLVLPGTFLDAPEAEDQSLSSRFQQMLSAVPLTPMVESKLHHEVPPMKWAFVRVDSHKPPLAQLYEGPYEVLRQSRNTALLQVGDKKDRISLNRLKPYLSLEEPEVAQPRPRGRPRKQ